MQKWLLNQKANLPLTQPKKLPRTNQAQQRTTISLETEERSFRLLIPADAVSRRSGCHTPAPPLPPFSHWSGNWVMLRGRPAHRETNTSPSAVFEERTVQENEFSTAFYWKPLYVFAATVCLEALLFSGSLYNV